MVRTRFAPSPTGYLHIGGVRTALFNWLFARHHGGQFVLRVDDTDRQRNLDAALAPILEGFRWLGLDWDEGPDIGGPYAPYYQSQRADRYSAAVESLIRSGNAYYDYARSEEIQAEREAAEQSKRSFTYSRRFMAETDVDRARFEADGRSAVVRLKMPREGKLVLDDRVRGKVEFQWAKEQDHVIQRADGSCLYHLATVVDDHDFQITHVIRAEEHLSNTPRQNFIAQALGYQLPDFAHVPFVAEPGSKTKLSKRKLDKYLKNHEFKALNDHGQRIAERIGISIEADSFNPVLVDFYEQMGFLPHAINNYLVLLGWSLDDKTEFFTREEMIEYFSLDRVNKAPASFDVQKLMVFQERYFNELEIKKKVAMVVPYLQKAALVNTPPPCETGPLVTRILEAAGDRIKVAGDILDYDDFFVADEALRYDEKAFEKRIGKPDEAIGLLKEFRERLATTEAVDGASLETLLKGWVESRQIKIGQIIHALRVAVTGKGAGFGMFDTLAILGPDKCLARIDFACQRAAQRADSP
jgi:glutamyl-tRNA synthetase